MRHAPTTIRRALTTGSLLLLLATGVLADPETELEQLGAGLKAAVITGQIDEEEAWEIWATAAEAMGTGKSRENDRDDAASLGDREDPKAFIGRLIPPDPTDPARLLEPEFLPRDVQLLINRLELTPEQAAIVEMIIEEYLRNFEVIATPLPIAVDRYQAREDQRDLEERMALLDRDLMTDEVDQDAALDLLAERVRTFAEESVAKEDGGDEELEAKVMDRAEEWNASLSQGLLGLDDRLAEVRRRMETRLAEVTAAGENISADDLLNLARTLRRQREGLRRDVEEMLQVIVVIRDLEAEQMALDEALAELRLRHGLRHARLGGEFINPWIVVSDTFPPPAEDPIVAESLRRQIPDLARLIRIRTETALDREILGLELVKVRDQLVEEYGDEDNVDFEQWMEVVEPFAASWERQIDASVSYRDGLLAIMETIAAAVAVTDPEAAARLRAATLRRGFAPETRPRWSERAIERALTFDDLDDATRVVLVAISEEIAEDLRRLRAQAIEQRMERDVELAKAPVLALWGFVPEDQAPWRESDWLGQVHEAHADRDDDTELTLQLVLTAEQFDRLPPRRGRDGADRKARRAKGGKGGAAGEKGKATGKGGAREKNGGRSTGSDKGRGRGTGKGGRS